MDILLLTTGGTIDSAKGSYPIGGPPPRFSRHDGPSQAWLILRNPGLAPAFSTRFHLPVCALDSKKIGQAEEARLQGLIRKFMPSVTRIVVTGGTDRLAPMAQRLAFTLPNPDCPVIFTGAFEPAVNGAHSDAHANVECAAFSRPGLPPKVYVAVGALFEEAAYVFKDFEHQCFRSARAPLLRLKHGRRLTLA